jgi:hypothetical protein
MKIDVVRADDGYAAIYLDGLLESWDNDEPFEMLARALEGKPNAPLEFAVHDLGMFGGGATQYEDPPDYLGDIPDRWWTDDRYVDGGT